MLNVAHSAPLDLHSRGHSRTRTVSSGLAPPSKERPSAGPIGQQQHPTPPSASHPPSTPSTKAGGGPSLRHRPSLEEVATRQTPRSRGGKQHHQREPSVESALSDAPELPEDEAAVLELVSAAVPSIDLERFGAFTSQPYGGGPSSRDKQLSGQLDHLQHHYPATGSSTAHLDLRPALQRSASSPYPPQPTNAFGLSASSHLSFQHASSSSSSADAYTSYVSPYPAQTQAPPRPSSAAAQGYGIGPSSSAPSFYGQQHYPQETHYYQQPQQQQQQFAHAGPSFHHELSYPPQQPPFQLQQQQQQQFYPHHLTRTHSDSYAPTYSAYYPQQPQQPQQLQASWSADAPSPASQSQSQHARFRTRTRTASDLSRPSLDSHSPRPMSASALTDYRDAHPSSASAGAGLHDLVSTPTSSVFSAQSLHDPRFSGGSVGSDGAGAGGRPRFVFPEVLSDLVAAAHVASQPASRLAAAPVDAPSSAGKRRREASSGDHVQAQVGELELEPESSQMALDREGAAEAETTPPAAAPVAAVKKGKKKGKAPASKKKKKAAAVVAEEEETSLSPDPAAPVGDVFTSDASAVPAADESPLLFKPSVSYAGMIGQAILAHPRGRIALSDIYAWISAAYPFYRPGQKGWMNSIRHNLSLNECFVKTARERGEPGKGSLWTIESGCEDQFAGGGYKRKPGGPGRKKGKKDGSAQPDEATSPVPAPPPAPVKDVSTADVSSSGPPPKKKGRTSKAAARRRAAAYSSDEEEEDDEDEDEAWSEGGAATGRGVRSSSPGYVDAQPKSKRARTKRAAAAAASAAVQVRALSPVSVKAVVRAPSPPPQEQEDEPMDEDEDEDEDEEVVVEEEEAEAAEHDATWDHQSSSEVLVATESFGPVPIYAHPSALFRLPPPPPPSSASASAAPSSHAIRPLLAATRGYGESGLLDEFTTPQRPVSTGPSNQQRLIAPSSGPAIAPMAMLTHRLDLAHPQHHLHPLADSSPAGPASMTGSVRPSQLKQALLAAPLELRMRPVVEDGNTPPDATVQLPASTGGLQPGFQFSAASSSMPPPRSVPPPSPAMPAQHRLRDLSAGVTLSPTSALRGTGPSGDAIDEDERGPRAQPPTADGGSQPGGSGVNGRVLLSAFGPFPSPVGRRRINVTNTHRRALSGDMAALETLPPSPGQLAASFILADDDPASYASSSSASYGAAHSPPRRSISTFAVTPRGLSHSGGTYYDEGSSSSHTPHAYPYFPGDSTPGGPKTPWAYPIASPAAGGWSAAAYGKDHADPYSTQEEIERSQELFDKRTLQSPRGPRDREHSAFISSPVYSLASRM